MLLPILCTSLHIQILTVLSISLNLLSYFSFFPQSQPHAPFPSLAPSLSLLVVGALRCDGERREEKHQNNKRGTTFS